MILNMHRLRGNLAETEVVIIDRTSQWGNPFRMKNESERLRVINSYRHWLWASIKEGHVALEDLADLHGKDLACWCAPKPCHGDVLERAAAWAHKQLGRS